MRRKSCMAAALAACAFAALWSCGGRKAETEVSEAEAFKSGLTPEDTAQVLKLCDDCMSALKAGRVDDALAGVRSADSTGSVSPLTAGQREELRNTFRLFPVLDYRLSGFTFNTCGLNEVKYEITFFEKPEGDSSPNTTAFMFNPVKYGGRWYLTVKRADQEVLGK